MFTAETHTIPHESTYTVTKVQHHSITHQVEKCSMMTEMKLTAKASHKDDSVLRINDGSMCINDDYKST